MLPVILIILGIVMIILGIIGCFIPVIPGPPLNYIALILVSLAKDWEPFTARFLIIWAIITVAVTLLDYVVPACGAKKYGASRIGILGSILGMLIGLIFFPPWGMLPGAFLGALVAELLVGKKSDAAFKASFGVFVGTIFGVGLKLVASGSMTFYFFKALF